MNIAEVEALIDSPSPTLAAFVAVGTLRPTLVGLQHCKSDDFADWLRVMLHTLENENADAEEVQTSFFVYTAARLCSDRHGHFEMNEDCVDMTAFIGRNITKLSRLILPAMVAQIPELTEYHLRKAVNP